MLDVLACHSCGVQPDASVPWLAAARALRDLATALVVGGLVLGWTVWRPLRRDGRVPGAVDLGLVRGLARVVLGAALVGAAVVVVGFVAYAGDAALRPLPELLDHEAGAGDRGGVRAALDTAVGVGLVASGIAFAVLAACAAAAARRGWAPWGTGTVTTGSGRWIPLAGAVALAVLLVAPAVGGNAWSSSRSVALVPLTVVHVVAASAWVGGVLGLLLVRRAVRTLDAGPARTRLWADVLTRFSAPALASIVALVVAGAVAALLQLASLYDLLETPYGRAVLAKIALLTGLAVLAVLHREWLVPRLRDAAAPSHDELARPHDQGPVGPPHDAAAPSVDAGSPGAPGEGRWATVERLVRRTVVGEVVLLLAVLGVTGALASSTPPREIAPSTSGRGEAGGLVAHVGADPARRGDARLRLEIHVEARLARRLGLADVDAHPVDPSSPGGPGGWSVLRARALPPDRDGRPRADPVDVDFRPGSPMGDPAWTADHVPLDDRGTWRLRITLRPPTPAGGRGGRRSPDVTVVVPIRIG